MSKRALVAIAIFEFVVILALVVHVAMEHASDREGHEHTGDSDYPQAEKQRKPGFVTQCKFRYHAPVDPIVVPGMRNSHNHAFYGGEVTEDSTRRTLLPGDTSCNVEADHSGYWAPAFRKKVDGKWRVIEPLVVAVYYRIGDDVNPEDVVSFPKGQQFLTGFKDATSPQDIVTYSCSGGGGNASDIVGDTPVNCPEDGEDPFPVARIFGPDCTNGVPTSEDDRSHTAYSSATNGQCPDGFKPTVLVRMDFRFPVGTNVQGAQLSSGSPYGFHADFMEAWDRPVLQKLMEECIRDGSGCTLKETDTIATQ